MRISDWSSDVCSSDLTEWSAWIASAIAPEPGQPANPTMLTYPAQGPYSTTGSLLSSKSTVKEFRPPLIRNRLFLRIDKWGQAAFCCLGCGETSECGMALGAKCRLTACLPNISRTRGGSWATGRDRKSAA